MSKQSKIKAKKT